MKRRHCHFTDVEVPFSIVLGDGRDPFEDLGNDARRYGYADVVIEEDILLRVFDAARRSASFADRVEWPGYVSELLYASDLPCFAFQYRFAASVFFYDTVIGATEVLT